MKPKILILLCIVILSFGKSNAALSRDSIPVTTQNALTGYNELMKKSHRQNTIGAILLCGGGVVGCIGAYVMLHEITSFFTSYGKNNTTTGEVLTYTGLGLMLLSIPFNVSGLMNKRKAKLFMKKESLGMITGMRANQSMTSVGIKINF